MTRVVFFGTPDVAVPSLEALVDAPDMTVVAVVTNPDRPRGRSHRPRPSAVKEAAIAAGIPVWQPARGRDVADQLRDAAPDVCAVVAYGSLLPRDVLDIPVHGFVNLHFSRLPRWRGAAPVQHAIRAGDTTTGVTTFVLDEGMDTGPIVGMTTTPIGPAETAGDLLARLAVEGAPDLVRALRDLVAGAVPTPQPDDGATHAPKVTSDDVAIDFDLPAARVAALVRSASPRPGAHTTWRGDRFKLLGAVVAAADGASAADAATADGPAADLEDVPPGTILHAGPDGLRVRCGDGAILVTRVQPSGKAAMEAGAFVNGYQPGVGERLGA